MLTVSATDWPSRRAAVQFFERQGWVKADGELVSPDGLYTVRPGTVSDEPHDKSYVWMQFVETDAHKVE